ncbi:hypothetical protein HMPREF0506_1550, partial [Lactobacillus crispatus JV-V01]
MIKINELGHRIAISACKNLLRVDFLIIVRVNEVKTKIKKAKFIFEKINNL